MAQTRVFMGRSDVKALRLAGRRFVWFPLALYASLTVGMWAAHIVFPSRFGAITNWTISFSGIVAVAFGGMYAAALALRQLSKPAATAAPGDATVVLADSEEPKRQSGRRKPAKPDEGRLRSEEVWAELQELENIR